MDTQLIDLTLSSMYADNSKTGLDYTREEFAAADAYGTMLKRIRNAYLDIMIYLPQRHAADAYDACYDAAIDLALAGSMISKRNIRRDAWRTLDNLQVRNTDVFSELDSDDVEFDISDGRSYSDEVEITHELLQRLMDERGLSQGTMMLDEFLQFADANSPNTQLRAERQTRRFPSRGQRTS